MKINNLTNNISFMAGKVQVYSDFDGTYCPAKHSSLRNAGGNEFMKEYCSKMDKFFKDTNGDLHFHVTTGRTFGEYETISQLLKKRGFHLPLPESFIAKNGSDEYIKKAVDSDFYSKGIFPYSFSEPNKIKEENIKKLTNWDGIKIKSFIKDLAKKYNINIIEVDSENSVKDYGNNSLFSENKLNPNEWKKLPAKDGEIIVHDIPVADCVIGARKDGNLKINLIFSPDYGYCPERNSLYDNFTNELKSFLNDEKVSFNMQWKEANKKNHYRKHCNITPDIEGNALTKLYDTREALKNAVKNNDMVIVAGDGINDIEMLNPLEYIEKSDWEKFKQNSQNKEFYDANMNKKLSYLKDVYDGKNIKLKQELETNGFLKKIEEMPLYSIIIKNGDSELGILNEVFGKTGKIIETEKGELAEGIQSAIKHHADRKKTFVQNMSDKLKNLILGTKPQKNYKKPAIILSSILLLLSGGIIYKHNKKTENSAKT